MNGPSYMAYFADLLPGNRAQLVCDVVIDGQLIQSYPVGSPAPLDVVKRHEHKHPLGVSA